MRASAEVIQDKAHEALTDLRGVLGVLRDGGTGELPLAAAADVRRPARRWSTRRAASGLRVEFEDLRRHGAVPDAVGRTVYRIVQEGITNARKHAPGALLTVADQRLARGRHRRACCATRSASAPTRTPGAGLGLVGLAERAELRGGRLEHGRDGAAFVLHGWIPWAA